MSKFTARIDLGKPKKFRFFELQKPVEPIASCGRCEKGFDIGDNFCKNCGLSLKEWQGDYMDYKVAKLQWDSIGGKDLNSFKRAILQHFILEKDSNTDEIFEYLCKKYDYDYQAVFDKMCDIAPVCS